MPPVEARDALASRTDSARHEWVSHRPHHWYDGHDKRMTNGERFARGLPPAAPRHLYGTETESDHGSGVVLGASSTVLGVIQITTEAGEVYYVGGSSARLVSSLHAATVVGYDPPVSTNTPVQVGIYFEKWGYWRTAGSWLGFVDPSYESEAGESSGIELYVSETSTPLGSAPKAGYVAHYTTVGYLETTVFTIDPSTGDMSVQWVDKSGSSAYTDATPAGFGIKSGKLSYGTNAFLVAEGFDPVASVTFIKQNL